MDTKHVFCNCIQRAVEGVKTGGATLLEPAEPDSGSPRRIARLDPWRTPATVSDYRESDFAACLSADRLKDLNLLVIAFRKLTGTFKCKSQIPTEDGKKADAMILRIHDIITEKSSAS